MDSTRAPTAAEWPPYLLIAGSGRSGTNRVLDAFDLHERTVCRSELEEMTGGDFAALPRAAEPEGLPEDFEARWRQAVDAARYRQSARDRIALVDKAYYRPRALARPVQKLLSHGRLRRALGRAAPALRAEEWPRPMAPVDAAALDSALLVMKLRPQEWLLRTHAADPAQQVVHKLRGPQGYLNSWYNRYVLRKGVERVFRESMAVLPPMMARFGERPERIGPFGEEALLESQVWIWRALNEPLHEGLKDSPRYRLVRYEDFGRAPVAVMAELFALGGLEMGPEHERRIASMSNTLFARAHSRKLDPALCGRVIRRVLADSPLLAIAEAEDPEAA